MGSFSDRIRGDNSVQSLDNKLISRIYGHGRGAVLTPNDFLDLGGRDAVDKALSVWRPRELFADSHAAFMSILKRIQNWEHYPLTFRR